MDEHIVQIDVGCLKAVRKDENRRIPRPDLPVDLIPTDHDAALVSPGIHHDAGSSKAPCGVGVDDVIFDAGVGGIGQLESVSFECLEDVALYRPVRMISPFARITVFIVADQHTIPTQVMEVVVLDGLFLAAPIRVLEKIGLEKPETFEGNWDFYDLEFTMKARSRGYKNYTKPILLRHESFGNLAGRDSWIKNKIAFTDKWHPPVKL